MPDDQTFRRPDDESVPDRVEAAEASRVEDPGAAAHDEAGADRVADGSAGATPGIEEAEQATAVRPAVPGDATGQEAATDQEASPGARPEDTEPEELSDGRHETEGEGTPGANAGEVPPPPILPVPPEFRQPISPGVEEPSTGEPTADEVEEPEPTVGDAGNEPGPEQATEPASAGLPTVPPAGRPDHVDVPTPGTDSPMPAAASQPVAVPGDVTDDPADPAADDARGSAVDSDESMATATSSPQAGSSLPPTVEPAGVDGEAPKGRSFRDWLRPDLSQTVIAILLAAFSFAVVTQIRARDQADSYSMLRQSDLVAMLDGLNQESERLESELDSLRQAQAELESGQDSEELARAQAEERLTSLGILAGTMPAQGPGITLTISDPQRNMKPGMILDAVEEMRDAGAEAIQINGTIRVVANSWVASGASGIIVDGQAVSTPITIDVIGDPHSLEEAARFRGGLVSQITDSRVGGQVSIVRSDELEISALHRQQAPRYAQPEESADGEDGTPAD